MKVDQVKKLENLYAVAFKSDLFRFILIFKISKKIERHQNALRFSIYGRQMFAVCCETFLVCCETFPVCCETFPVCCETFLKKAFAVK